MVNVFLYWDEKSTKVPAEAVYINMFKEIIESSHPTLPI